MSTHRPYRRILVWFRRALRVDDNPALWNALHDGEEVVPLLCLSGAPSYQKLTERRTFLRSVIRSLDADLRDRGTALHVRPGDPLLAIPAAAAAYQADAVYAVALHDAPGMHRDAQLKKKLEGMGVVLILWPDRVMREANEVLTATGSQYKVFTPYKRAWLLGADDVPQPVPMPRTVRSVAMADGSQSLAALSWSDGVRCDASDDAQRLLRAFLKKSAAHYAARRDIPG
ncbi:MAG TPA: deoxyribodipyrimidine photo-lyase, partial [Bacteroidota bacterium]|nr:deoxyribodipyrimidine photo-lyase [Bacteroidota bacterium]